MNRNIRNIIIFFISVCILFVSVIALNSFLLENSEIPKGYSKKEEYSDPYGFRDYTDYYKYYYTSDNDYYFESSETYNKVEDENIKELKSYVTDFKEKMEAGKRLSDYDLDESIINNNDYFMIFDKNNRDFETKYAKFSYYTVHFYDISSHILYVLHTSS